MVRSYTVSEAERECVNEEKVERAGGRSARPAENERYNLCENLSFFENIKRLILQQNISQKKTTKHRTQENESKRKRTAVICFYKH